MCPLSRKRKQRCFPPDVTEYTRLRERSSYEVYDYSNVKSYYFADLDCYLKVLLVIQDLPEQINENFIHLECL